MNPVRTHLRPDTAQAIIDPVRPDFRVTEVVTRTGGEVSAVHEVRAAGAVPPLIVKIYAPRWRPKLVKEVYVYRVLARHGIRHIPRVLHAAPFGIPALPFAYAVMTRLEGRPLSEVRGDLAGADVAGVYHHMGRLLAAVHRITQDRWGYVSTRVVDGRPTNTAYMSDQFARRLRDFVELGGDPVLARRIAGHVDRHAGLFAACTGAVLCHNDFHDGNVLASPAAGRWGVTGFVDVEGAVAADPLFDLARTDYHALRHDPARRGAFLSGYGPKPADWTDRVALYRIHHALELWNWASSTGKPADRARARTDLEEML